ncbi:MAG TPA: tryptophan--tRNA ligase, partial [Candidatus Limnocylindria bacterium]|nr:tryptophan--tRNA ligase [Candidatus Limnocylindria bacterium]
TGELTVANYLGAVVEVVGLQKEFEPVVFVADIHGLTDQDPGIVAEHKEEVVKDFLALGVDPERASIFMQSDILPELGATTLLLSRELTLNELTGVPTLKDQVNKAKLKEGKEGEDDPLSAKVMLGLYPVLMAADILAQRAHLVPVGKDQISHLELTRRLAERFNDRHSQTFPMPEAYVTDGDTEPLRILSLKGDGKMSKSERHTALFLADSPGVIEQKLRRAQTGPAGELTPHITSLSQIAKGLSTDTEVHQRVDDLIGEHMDGEPVMGTFKGVVTGVVNDFLADYRQAGERIAQDPGFVQDVLENGRGPAKERAAETLQAMQDALKL